MIPQTCPRTGLVCTQCTAPCLQQQPWITPNMGWQCPKCGRGNAPFVLQCPCGPTFTTTYGAGASGTAGMEPTESRKP